MRPARPLRVLVLGLNYAPEPISTAVYTEGMVAALADAGHDVTVVTAPPYYPGWRVFAGYSALRYKVEHPRPGVTLVRCPLYVPRRPTGMRRLLHHMSFALSAFPALLNDVMYGRPDLVLAIAPGLLAGPVGWAVARVSGAPCWLHVQDFEVEAARATGLLPGGRALGRGALGTESVILRGFDRVSTISAPMHQRLLDKGIDPARAMLVPNWADLEGVRPGPEDPPLRAELGLTGKRVLLYSGTLGRKQGLELFPDLARRFAHRPDVALVVCGDGPMRGDLARAAEGLPNLHLLPLQPAERLGELLAMAEMHLLPQIAGAADLVLPSKLTNMMASGRPVVATADPGTAIASAVGGCGAVVPPGDLDGLANAVGSLLDDPDLRARLGARARTRAEALWDRQRILPRFVADIEALAATRYRPIRRVSQQARGAP
ncbi:MAG: WcaI family glycosyltransferase [Rhodobacteraceae bacterium]|nr:WcaI family glycosyltransferase [Paracoccaceae bacterium]